MRVLILSPYAPVASNDINQKNEKIGETSYLVHLAFPTLLATKREIVADVNGCEGEKVSIYMTSHNRNLPQLKGNTVIPSEYLPPPRSTHGWPIDSP